MFTVNGMTYTDIGANVNMSSATDLLLGMNEVQEATVVSNGYSGQFGVLAGANVNYITKSGGNEFHGNALYFWNGRALNANDWINNATGVPRPFDNANQWAGSIGGPIKKDKLFFFFDTEGLRLLVPPATQQVVLPSPQFEAATIANIDSKFGPTSASDAFYKQIFALYNGAPGANRPEPGDSLPPRIRLAVPGLCCQTGWARPYLVRCITQRLLVARRTNHCVRPCGLDRPAPGQDLSLGGLRPRPSVWFHRPH